MSTVAEIVLDNQGCPYVNWYETGKDFYDQYPVGTKFCAKEPSLEESIAELEQENRLLRARNDRLEKEFVTELDSLGNRNFHLRMENHKLKAGQPTQEQIIAGAKALNKRSAEICEIDEGDQWKVYGEELIEDAHAVLIAAFNLKG